MSFSDYQFLVRSDLYRLAGKSGLRYFFSQLWSGEEGFRFCFWLRTCAYLKQGRLTKYLLYPLARLFYQHYRYKFGISIPFSADIGSGFYIGHFGGLVVNGNAVIGKNCNISQGVTIGQTNRGNQSGSPVIGDNVYIGPGAKVVGGISIGDHVAIGANSVVTRDVPANSVTAGIPAKVLSDQGSAGYVENTDY